MWSRGGLASGCSGSGGLGEPVVGGVGEGNERVSREGHGGIALSSMSPDADRERMTTLTFEQLERSPMEPAGETLRSDIAIRSRILVRTDLAVVEGTGLCTHNADNPDPVEPPVLGPVAKGKSGNHMVAPGSLGAGNLEATVVPRRPPKEAAGVTTEGDDDFACEKMDGSSREGGGEGLWFAKSTTDSEMTTSSEGLPEGLWFAESDSGKDASRDS
mmetsp:Transcript_23476/g.51013  ORF Transcript_23476/g.51013 Transcript_23476/m.51013 type:complete len:216 (-) Transcript_23476:354-1001(-)